VRILVLGGTKFLGRAFVEASLAAGHELTLFTRGRTNPELFPEARHVRGDRERDLSPLDDGTWDAVVDTSTHDPAVVRVSAEALRGRVRRYLYVSSISAYADLSTPPVEGAPTAEEPPGEYGPLKAASERVVQEVVGERALTVRPGLIVGPHDESGRFTYWPHRIARGGDVLVPGEPRDRKQFIDVRDLAEWMLRMLERDEGGLYNATGEPIAFGDLVTLCCKVTGAEARLHWVPSADLVAAGVGEWIELPLWIASPEYAGMQQADVSRALAAGLRFRPLEETVRDTLSQASPVDGVGLAADRERELLGR
jgi:nucleoside-diphosphate-sugar epimerase